MKRYNVLMPGKILARPDTVKVVIRTMEHRLKSGELDRVECLMEGDRLKQVKAVIHL